MWGAFIRKLFSITTESVLGESTNSREVENAIFRASVKSSSVKIDKQ